MGLLSGLGDIGSNLPDFGISNTAFPGANYPGWFGMLQGEEGSELQQLVDPMDLFGVQAGQTQEQISGILEQSAQAGIDAQEAQREQIRELYEPYYNAAINEGLPQLQAMSEGGEIDYTPSRLYEYQKDRGERNIKRQMAAGGLSQSSAAQEKLSDFRLGLAQEEMDRLYQGELSRVQLGSGAADAVGAASRTLGGNVAGLYSNLGGGLNMASQQYGEARQSAYTGLSSSLSGMSQYMEQGA